MGRPSYARFLKRGVNLGLVAPMSEDYSGLNLSVTFCIFATRGNPGLVTPGLNPG